MKSNALLYNRYKLIEQLSHKAGRRTFLAYDLETNTQVIAKILQFDQMSQWDEFKLFEREVKTLKNLDHPLIPKYLDYFELEEDNTHYSVLIQTYIDGLSLETLIKEGRKFTEEEVKQIAERVLGILTYLHELNPSVIHRDIKPSNILLSQYLTENSRLAPPLIDTWLASHLRDSFRKDKNFTDECGINHLNEEVNVISPQNTKLITNIYLVDFGAVQTVLNKNSGTITIVGSYGYMPLEQFNGKTQPASDLYSLGMTLIYLLTGVHPADLPKENGKVKLSDYHISRSFKKWLEKMTYPYLNKRFTSANLALTDLKSTTNSSNDHTYPKPPNSRLSINYNDEIFEIPLLCFKINKNSSFYRGIDQIVYDKGYQFNQFNDQGRIETGKITIPPSVSVYEKGIKHSISKRYLSQEECHWIAQELSNFLEIPITYLDGKT